MLEGLSIPRYLKLSDNALGADNQQERPVGRSRFRALRARFVEGHDFSRAVTAAEISRALAPGVALLNLAGILRDYMPDSDESLLEKI